MNYSLSAILDEAKLKRVGRLKTLNLAIIAYGGIAILLGLPSVIAEATVAEPGVLLASQLIFDFFLSPLLTLPLVAGLACLGLACAREEAIRVGAIFSYYNRMWSFYGFTLLSWLFFALVGFCFYFVITAAAGYEIFPVVLTICTLSLALLAIYVSILISFTVLLIADQSLGPLAAIKRSIAAVRLSGCFALLFKYYFMLFLWTILGLFTLGIAYFWIFPKYMIAYGIIYRDLFDAKTVITDSGNAAYESPLAKYS